MQMRRAHGALLALLLVALVILVASVYSTVLTDRGSPYSLQQQPRERFVAHHDQLNNNAADGDDYGLTAHSNEHSGGRVVPPPEREYYGGLDVSGLTDGVSSDLETIDLSLVNATSDARSPMPTGSISPIATSVPAVDSLDGVVFATSVTTELEARFAAVLIGTIRRFSNVEVWVMVDDGLDLADGSTRSIEYYSAVLLCGEMLTEQERRVPVEMRAVAVAARMGRKRVVYLSPASLVISRAIVQWLRAPAARLEMISKPSECDTPPHRTTAYIVDVPIHSGDVIGDEMREAVLREWTLQSRVLDHIAVLSRGSFSPSCMRERKVHVVALPAEDRLRYPEYVDLRVIGQASVDLIHGRQPATINTLWVHACVQVESLRTEVTGAGMALYQPLAEAMPHAAPLSEVRENIGCALVVMLTDIGYFDGLLTFIASAQRTREHGAVQYDLVVILSHFLPSIGDIIVELRAWGVSEVIVLNPLQSDDIPKAWRGSTRRWNWTVLYMWQLVQYSRVVYCDIDMIVVHEMDHLCYAPWEDFPAPTALRSDSIAQFDQPVEFAAVLNWETPNADWGSSAFNGGFFVTEPSAAAYNALIAAVPLYAGSVGVQPFLNAAFGYRVRLLDKLAYNVNTNVYVHRHDEWDPRRLVLLHYTWQKPWSTAVEPAVEHFIWDLRGRNESCGWESEPLQPRRVWKAIRKTFANRKCKPFGSW